MKVKTARAMRDLLSMILASVKDKNLEDHITIHIDRSNNSPHDQYIIIRFRKEID